MFLKKRIVLRFIRENKLLKISLFLFVLSLSLNVYKTYLYSLKSSTYAQVEKKIIYLMDEVSALRYQVSMNSSLAKIEEKAKSIGFVKIEEKLPVLKTKLALKSDNEMVRY